MKKLFLLLLAIGITCQLSAVDIKMLDGREFKDVTVLNKTPSGVDIQHAEGVAFLKFIEMSEDSQKQLGYSFKKELAHQKEVLDAQQQLAKKEQANKEKIAEYEKKLDLERKQNHLKNIKQKQDMLNIFMTGELFLSSDLSLIVVQGDKYLRLGGDDNLFSSEFIIPNCEVRRIEDVIQHGKTLIDSKLQEISQLEQKRTTVFEQMKLNEKTTTTTTKITGDIDAHATTTSQTRNTGAWAIIKGLNIKIQQLQQQTAELSDKLKGMEKTAWEFKVAREKLKKTKAGFISEMVEDSKFAWRERVWTERGGI
ncbi:MAG: hypothetical protein A2020_12215 [Lentisphaerae bacterium GWF2_45_14]|nr:MAG: hypothetical protein A2020_12215 [Lentisphaerae bacterium GWF2_45_14]